MNLLTYLNAYLYKNVKYLHFLLKKICLTKNISQLKSIIQVMIMKKRLKRLKKKSKKNQYTWVYNKTFESTAEASLWLETEKTWGLRQNYICSNGRRNVYRCNKVPARGDQCKCALYLQYPDDDETVLVYISEETHTHDQILAEHERRGLTEETKIFITDLLSKGVSIPKLIANSIAKEAINNPDIKLPKNLRQLYNYLENAKKR